MSNNRDYNREYEKYHKTEKQKKRRADRNKARRKALREGRVTKGDGKDVHHPTHDTGSKKTSVVKKGTNRAKNLGKGGRPKGS